MTPPARGTLRLCSSALVPLVLLALLWRGGAAPHLQASLHAKGVLPAIPSELPDGVHLMIAKPAPARSLPAQWTTTHVAWPAIPREALDGMKRSVFSGLGAWVDLYDYPVLQLEKTIAELKRAGVQTLYIETGMSGYRQLVAPASVQWLVAAHRAGMKVVGWFLPTYVNVRADVIRTIAIARVDYRGIRFDGVGIDIEYKGALPNNRVWNRNVVKHLYGVRRALGTDYPLAAIPPPPLQMRLAPATWDGFPWSTVGRYSSEIMLMSYWSFRTGCPVVRMSCAYDFTKYNVLLTRQLTGGRVPIHVIGGVADHITGKQLQQFVRGAIDAHADGASLYDVGTTDAGWWRSLRALRALGP